MSDNAPAVQVSEGLWDWLDEPNRSLGFTACQSNRPFLAGRRARPRLGLHERLFDKSMRLYVRDSKRFMACRYQLWQFSNILHSAKR